MFARASGGRRPAAGGQRSAQQCARSHGHSRTQSVRREGRELVRTWERSSSDRAHDFERIERFFVCPTNTFVVDLNDGDAQIRRERPLPVAAARVSPVRSSARLGSSPSKREWAARWARRLAGRRARETGARRKGRRRAGHACHGRSALGRRPLDGALLRSGAIRFAVRRLQSATSSSKFGVRTRLGPETATCAAAAPSECARARLKGERCGGDFKKRLPFEAGRSRPTPERKVRGCESVRQRPHLVLWRGAARRGGVPR